MHITNIDYYGLKGQTHSRILTNLTLVTGENRSGKTTVREAIILAITGQHPTLGKTNQAIMKLANSSVLRVSATVGDQTVRRQWERGTGGSVTTDHTVPDGWQDGLDEIAFSPRKFIELTPKPRLDYLAAMADADAIRNIVSEVSVTDDIAIDPTLPPFEQLTQLEAELIDRRKSAKQERGRLKSHLQELQAGGPEGQRPDDDPTENALALRKKEAEASQKLEAVESRIRVLKRTIAELEKDTQIDVEFSALSDAETEQLAELTARQSAAIASNPARQRIESEIDELRHNLLPETQLNEAKTLAANPEPHVPANGSVDLQGRKAEAEADMRALRADLDAKKEAVDALDEETQVTLRLESCPTCGSEGDHWHAAYAQQRKKVEDLAATKMANAQRAFDRIERQWEQLVCDIAAAETAERLHHEWKEARLLVEEAGRDTEKIATLEAEAKGLPAFTEADARQLQSLEQRAKAAKSAEVSAEAVAKITTARAELEQLEGEHSQVTREAGTFTEQAQAADAAVKRWNDHAEHDTAITETTERLAAAETAVETAEKRCTEVTDAKGRVLEATWLPITGVATRVLRAVFDDDTVSAYGTATDFGLRDGAGFRPFETLSGSEQVCCAFAFGLAIASRSKIPVAMVDELSRLDPVCRARFFLCCEDLIDDETIGQIVVFDHGQLPDSAAQSAWSVLEIV